MSGEAVVLVNIALGPLGVAAVAGASALVAAGMVAEWIRERRAIAQRNVRREKEKIREWRDFQRAEQQETEKSIQRRETVRRELEGLRLTQLHAAVEQEAGPRARGFVRTGSPGLEAMLQSMLDRIPPQPDGEAAAPLRRLRQQARELDARMGSARPPPPEAVRSFQTTVQRTLERILDQMGREAESRDRLLARLEGLLGEVIAYRHLAREQTSCEEMSQLREHLVRLLTTGEVSAAGVDLLEEKLQRLRADIERQLEQAAVQDALDHRVRHHLEALGYRPCASAGEPAVWEIPGGERVRVVLQPDNRLAFQLAHERTTASDQALSDDELAYLRQQERRWCDDLHGLLHRLQADGFEFQVQLEREIPREAIPIVVVEDVDDWIEREDAPEAPRKRHLP